MGKRISFINSSSQLLQLTKQLCLLSRQRRIDRKQGIHKLSTGASLRNNNLKKDVTTPWRATKVANNTRNASDNNSSNICIYNFILGTEGPALSTGSLNNRTGPQKNSNRRSLSLYLGISSGFYFIRRKLLWRNDALFLGPTTQNFLRVLFGPHVKKVVYSDALDLAHVLKGYFSLPLGNILDLSYMHMIQDGLATMTTSRTMFEELKENRLDISWHRNDYKRYHSTHLLALKHLSLVGPVTKQILGKQGHSEHSWRQRIATMIDAFISHPVNLLYAHERRNALEQGQFTPGAFRSRIEAVIDRALGHSDTHLEKLGTEFLIATLKSKSFLDRTAFLSVRAFVISKKSKTIKPLYATVSAETFHQLADKGVGDVVELVPVKNEQDEVCLTNIYDKVCFKATRLHGESLLYNLRTGTLVPRVTLHR